MSQFKQYVINHFDYLEQFGYIAYVGEDINLISYKGRNNQIDIIFSPCELELTCLFIDNDNNRFSLQDGLDYIEIKDYKGLYQVANKTNIEQGISYLSKAVKKLLEIINITELINFQKVFQYSIDMHKKKLKDYYLEIDLKRAENYWKEREYIKAKELFKKNIEYLSQSQLKKLKYIENHEQFMG